MAGLIGTILGGVVAAIIFGSVEGWTYSVGAGVSGRSVFNELGLIWVAVGMILGAIIAVFGKKLLSAINSPKGNEQSSAADEIKKLKDLLDNGTITEAEFNQQKRKILNESITTHENKS